MTPALKGRTDDNTGDEWHMHTDQMKRKKPEFAKGDTKVHVEAGNNETPSCSKHLKQQRSNK
jgi:hypothetical protein